MITYYNKSLSYVYLALKLAWNKIKTFQMWKLAQLYRIVILAIYWLSSTIKDKLKRLDSASDDKINCNIEHAWDKTVQANVDNHKKLNSFNDSEKN